MHDASADGGVDAGDDEDASSDFDASLGFDATGLPSIDAGGPSACHGSTDCSVGSLCCFDVGAVRAPASCIVGAACPTDDAELCGVSGDEKCKTGTCADYECTATTPHVQLTFFACGVPALPNVSCGIVEPSEDAGEP